MTVPVFHQRTGQMDVQIAFSRDGLIWYRPERQAIINLGPQGSDEDCMVGGWLSAAYFGAKLPPISVQSFHFWG